MSSCNALARAWFTASCAAFSACAATIRRCSACCFSKVLSISGCCFSCLIGFFVGNLSATGSLVTGTGFSTLGCGVTSAFCFCTTGFDTSATGFGLAAGTGFGDGIFFTSTGLTVSIVSSGSSAGNVTNSISIGGVCLDKGVLGVDGLIATNATAVSTCSPSTTKIAIKMDLRGSVSKSVELIIL